MDSAIPLLLLVPLLLIAFRGSKQRKQVSQMQRELGPGSEVMTGSGQFGTVVSIADDRVELEVAPGVRTWWLRQAVARQVDPVVVADDEVDEDLDDELLDDDRAEDVDDVLADDNPRRQGLTDRRTGGSRPVDGRDVADGHGLADESDERPGGTRRSA